LVYFYWCVKHFVDKGRKILSKIAQFLRIGLLTDTRFSDILTSESTRYSVWTHPPRIAGAEIKIKNQIVELHLALVL